MHVLNSARNDPRVLREASALARAGMEGSLVDIELDARVPRAERDEGIDYKHIRLPTRLMPHFSLVSVVPWILFKVVRMGLGIWAVLRTPADLYHAQDITALPACYLAAMLRRKLLIYDAHELTLADVNVD